MASAVKNSPKEIWVHSLSGEDSLEKEMATHSSILAWKNPMDRGARPGTIYGVTKRKTQLSSLAIGILKNKILILYMWSVSYLFKKVHSCGGFSLKDSQPNDTASKNDTMPIFQVRKQKFKLSGSAKFLQ